MSSMPASSFSVGSIHFHDVTKVESYIASIGLSNWVELTITHNRGERVDQVTIFADPHLLDSVADCFDRGPYRPNVFSPIPSFHRPTPSSLTREALRFEEFEIFIHWEKEPTS